MIIEEIINRAKQVPQRIVLPESDDIRILSAAAICAQEKIANVVLIGDADKIHAAASSHNVVLPDAIEIINPVTSELTSDLAQNLYQLRKHKGMTFEQAQELCQNDAMYFSCMYLHENHVDGIVAGSNHSTSDTLRPALQILKGGFVSAFFLMEVPDCKYGEHGTFIFADSGLNQNPTSEELASIAIDSAHSFRDLVQAEPKVAFLSHSTKGSAAHPDVDKVTSALKFAREQSPELAMDGEMQADAALDAHVAELKLNDKKSPVAGQANVLVFPDLDSANVAYKLVQYLAKAKAYGPITQGLSKPVNDLSRGCTVEDIVGAIAITSAQSIKHDIM